MSEEAIMNMDENLFKAYVKIRVRKVVFEDLREVQSGHIKVKHIKLSCLNNPQKYLTSKLLNNQMRSLLYNLRSRSVKTIKDNFHEYYKGNVFCPLKCLHDGRVCWIFRIILVQGQGLFPVYSVI